MRLVATLTTLCATPSAVSLQTLAISRPHAAYQRHPIMCERPLIDLPEHVRYLEEVALSVAPAGLRPTATLLSMRGEELLQPGVDPTLHPLLVPLTRSEVDGEVTGLLRWPGASGGATKLPVVRTSGRQLELLATSTENYIARQLVLADADMGDGDATEQALLVSLANDCGISYKQGTASASPGGVAGYLIMQFGPYPQEYERLATNHLSKGAEQAALVACERNQQCFDVWGRPFSFHAKTLRDMGRLEEARDVARQALDKPLWTLGEPLEDMLAIAETSHAELVTRLELKAEGKMTAEQLRANNGIDKRTPQQVARERATYVMDLVIANTDDFSWSSTRSTIAALYKDAGMEALASFVEFENAARN